MFQGKKLPSVVLLCGLLMPVGCGEQIIEDSRGAKAVEADSSIQAIRSANQPDASIIQSNAEAKTVAGPISETNSTDTAKTAESSANDVTGGRDTIVLDTEPALPDPVSISSAKVSWEPKEVFAIVETNCSGPCHTVHRNFEDYNYFISVSSQIERSVTSGRMPPLKVRPDFSGSSDKAKLLEYLQGF